MLTLIKIAIAAAYLGTIGAVGYLGYAAISGDEAKPAIHRREPAPTTAPVEVAPEPAKIDVVLEDSDKYREFIRKFPEYAAPAVKKKPAASPKKATAKPKAKPVISAPVKASAKKVSLNKSNGPCKLADAESVSMRCIKGWFESMVDSHKSYDPQTPFWEQKT